MAAANRISVDAAAATVLSVGIFTLKEQKNGTEGFFLGARQCFNSTLTGIAAGHWSGDA